MEIFKLFGSIFVNTEDADRSLQKTEKNTDNFSKKLGEGIKTAAKWGAGIVTAVGGAMVAVAESTREYRNEMAKLETAYETAGFSAEDATSIYRELNAVLGDTGQAVEASNHLAMLCDTEEELATWADICTGVYATFGASLPIEGLTEAANETAKVGQITGSLADALNWAGVSEDEFQASLDRCNSEQERQALITETLNGLYSSTAEAYRINNAEVLNANAANEKWNATLAQIGAVVEPIITQAKIMGATLLEQLVPAIEWINGGLQSFTAWAQEHQTTIEVLVTVIGSFAAAFVLVNGALTVFSTVAGIASAAGGILGGVIAFLTSPITLVIAAIGALIAVGVLLYKNWDTVKAKCNELWTNVTQKFNALKESVVGKVTEIKTNVLNKFNEIKDGIAQKIEAARDKVKGAIDKIKGFFNFSWSLPHLKMPHPRISGSFSLNPPSVPSFSIDWYGKAMNDPMIMESPTMFGINSMGEVMAGGERGSEVVSGTDTLMRMIAQAVASQNGNVVEAVYGLRDVLLHYLPQLANMQLVMDSGAIVGELAEEIDYRLGKLAFARERGV